MLEILVANELDAKLFNALPNARANQSIELILKFVEGRMGVKLGIAGGQMQKQIGDVGLIHARVLQQAKDSARVAPAESPENGPDPGREWMKEKGMKRTIDKMARGQTKI